MCQPPSLACLSCQHNVNIQRQEAQISQLHSELILTDRQERLSAQSAVVMRFVSAAVAFWGAKGVWHAGNCADLEKDYMACGQARKGSSQLCPDQRRAIIGDWQQLAGYCPFSCQSVLFTHTR